MKLASLNNGARDGLLVLVNAELSKMVRADDIVPTLQQALDQWQSIAPRLNARYQAMQEQAWDQAETFHEDEVLSPLPRAYQFVDGSAYLAHVERVRKARGAEMPPSFLHDPLMYQAVSDGFLSPRENVRVSDEAFGIDFESEVAVITDDVPMGVDAATAGEHIQLIMIMNDVSLRNLIPAELSKGFGFLQSKPRSAFSPVAVTPDELGDAWRDYTVHLPLLSTYNQALFGEPESGEDMQFNFAQLIAHAARTRPLAAGTIVGSGTVANQDKEKGASCLAEKRMLEIIEHGEAKTPFMAYGDRIQIEMKNMHGNSIFGMIDQTITD